MSLAFWKASAVQGKLSVIGIIRLILAIPLAYVNTYLSFLLGIIIFMGQLLKKK